MARFLLLCIPLMWAQIFTTSSAAASKKRIAVLEFANAAGLNQAEVDYLANLVRGEALNLDQSTYLVMTRENILEMLPPGVDLASCEGGCEVETGRNIGASYVLTGEVIRFDGSLKFSVRLYDTESSALQGQEIATATRLLELEDPIKEAVSRLLKPLRHPQNDLEGNGNQSPKPPPTSNALSDEEQQILSNDKDRLRESRLGLKSGSFGIQIVLNLGVSYSEIHSSGLSSERDFNSSQQEEGFTRFFGTVGGIFKTDFGLGLHLEAGYTPRGGKHSLAEFEDSTAEFNYIITQGLIRYDFGTKRDGYITKDSFYVCAGAEMAWLLAQKFRTSASITSEDISERDFSAVLGGGLDLGRAGFGIGLRLIQGFEDLNLPSLVSEETSSFAVVVLFSILSD
ncbi:MAG: hypothetical protein ACE366_16515 [Bradymonadia bacterium]